MFAIVALAAIQVGATCGGDPRVFDNEQWLMSWPRSPQWTPDGSEVVFARNGQIYRGAANGSGLHALTTKKPTNDGFDYDAGPVLSPDGSRVVYSTLRHLSRGWLYNWEIVTTDLDGNDHRRLTNDEGVDAYPAWSPDGTRIAFSSDREGPFNIYTMAADGGDVERVVFASPPSLPPIVWWSPTGSHLAFLAFMRTTNEDPPPRTSWREAYIVRPDGSDLVALGRVGSPLAWSPAGQRIAFVRVDED